MNKIKVKLLNPEQINGLYITWSQFAAKCYNSKINPEKPEAIGKHCHSTGHTSGSRTTHFIFEITGVSRACTAQLNRHSIGVVINEQSMRYVDFSEKDIKIPPEIEKIPEAKTLFEKTSSEVKNTYTQLVQILKDNNRTHEQAKEDARYILSMGIETEGCWGFDIEALEHFCNKRLCLRAQWEIREVARQMKKAVAEVRADIAEKLVPHCQELGYCPENNQQCSSFKNVILTEKEFKKLIHTAEFKQMINKIKQKE